ncbi:MAG TPA: 3',5'-cyclic-nucleotide phosphodiesterase [Syntrophorhabdaceae bacterium]|nr:3',5'-cyclic-nucleotide phosphodiesterase [Syntrophorhabdaceae bacterium]
MKIDVLGCYGNAIGEFKSTCFLIDGTTLLDAGTVTSVLKDHQLKEIKHVIVTHTHLDHIKDLVFLVDELVMMGKFTIELVSVKEILDIISNNLFNNRLWPDFTVIPSYDNAVIKLKEIILNEYTTIGNLSVKPILMTHTVYCVGYIIKNGGKGFMFTSDTGPTKAFWETAKTEKGIEFIIADVSFPNRMEELARVSGHMTLNMLIEHIDRYELNNVPFLITHIKPIFLEEIIHELSQMGRPNIRPLIQGETIHI